MFDEKVVFITGSASGIGLDIGKAFLIEKAKVVFTDKDEEKLLDVVARFKVKGLDCMGICCDVTDEKEIMSAIDKTMGKYGRLDILINNAGLQYIAPIEAFPTTKFEDMIHVMLIAPFKTMKHVFPIMKNQQAGRIINIASINGLIGFSGKAAYNSAKHGVIGLTKVAALESAEEGITVNALCPGYVETPLVRNQLKDLAENRKVEMKAVLEEVIYPFVPQKRLLQTTEVADYVLFLASDKAKSVTGQAVVMDGGYTAQ